MENQIGEIIEKHRKSQGWSRKYLAEKLGVHVSMISFYERGVKIPSDKKKLILCDLFNISLQELIGESPDIKLKKDIKQLLFDMDLNKNELQFIIDRIKEFYCNKGNYDIFKDFHISNATIDISKVENSIMKIESLLFNFFKEEIYQKKNKNKVITMAEISKYIQENFSNALNGIINSLNENEILHELFISIYEELTESNSNEINTDLFANVNIKGYTTIPKEYTNKNTELFGLLITEQSNMDRYKYNDVVIFQKYNNYSYNTDILVSMNGKLKIVQISKMEDKPKTKILIYTQKENFDIYTEKELKEMNFKILGFPIEIKINYFNRKHDI